MLSDIVSARAYACVISDHKRKWTSSMASGKHLDTGTRPAEEPDPGAVLLADTVRNRRDRLGLTQQDVSEFFGGPSVASMRNLESGQSDAYRAKTLSSLDQALGWPPGASKTLLTGKVTNDVTRYMRRIDDDLRSWQSANQGKLNANLVKHLVKRVTDEDAEKFDLTLKLTGDPFSPVENTAPEDRDFRQGVQTGQADDGNSAYQRIVHELPKLVPDELNKIIDFATSLAKVYKYMDGPSPVDVDKILSDDMTRQYPETSLDQDRE